MSSRAAEMLKDDFEAKGPVKGVRSGSRTEEILKIVRKLADDGQIVLTGRAGKKALSVRSFRPVVQGQALPTLQFASFGQITPILAWRG